jgi:competence protein ComEC
MPQLHFMNVGQGDCTWIQHADGKNTVIDVCNGNAVLQKSAFDAYVDAAYDIVEARKGLSGNFRQKDSPVNPIEYMKSFGVSSIFRFIATHPDMDHLDGIKAIFDEFGPVNFWDTDNSKEIANFDSGRFSEEDWSFYKGLRNGSDPAGAKRLALHSGAKAPYYNQGEGGVGGGNGLFVLSPTKELVANANDCDDFNDCSYVLLYRTGSKKIVIGGDSHDASWEHILANHRSDVEDVDLLIAPHHGRASDRSYDFLDVLRPKLTFFGVAKSEHLGYSGWRNRDLEVMTNNQGNCFVVDITEGSAVVYCTYKTFAHTYCRESFKGESFFNLTFNSWYLKTI